MIQQRSTVHQTYFDPQAKRVRQRPVRQFARVHFDHKAMTFKVPKKKSRWGQLLSNLFRKAA